MEIEGDQPPPTRAEPLHAYAQHTRGQKQPAHGMLRRRRELDRQDSRPHALCLWGHVNRGYYRREMSWRPLHQGGRILPALRSAPRSQTQDTTRLLALRLWFSRLRFRGVASECGGWSRHGNLQRKLPTA
eukprot:1030576-Rhodomonas_salina.3